MNEKWIEKVKMHTIYDSNLDFCNKNLKIPEEWWREFITRLGNGGRKTLYCSIFFPNLQNINIRSYALFFKHLIDLGFKIYFFEQTEFMDTVQSVANEIQNTEGGNDNELAKIMNYNNFLRLLGAKEGDYNIIKEKDFLEKNVQYFNKSFPESRPYFSYLDSIKMENLWHFIYKKYQGSFLSFFKIINDVYYAYLLSSQDKIDFIFSFSKESLIHRYCLKVLSQKVPESKKDLIPVVFPLTHFSFIEVDKKELEKLRKEELVKIIYMSLRLYEEVTNSKLSALKEVRNKSTRGLMQISKEELIKIVSNGSAEIFMQFSKELNKLDPKKTKKVQKNLNTLLNEIINKKYLYEILQVLYKEGLSKASNSFSIRRVELRKKVAEFSRVQLNTIKENTFSSALDRINDFGLIEKKQHFGRDIYTIIIIPDKQKINEIIELLEKLEQLLEENKYEIKRITNNTRDSR